MRAETGSSRPSVWDDRPRIDKAGQNRRSDGWKSDVYCQPRQGASDFGMTVSSRCRLVVPKAKETKPENKFAKYASS